MITIWHSLWDTSTGSRLGPAESCFIIGVCTARPWRGTWPSLDPILGNVITVSNYIEKGHCIWPQNTQTQGLTMGLLISVILGK